MKLLTAIWNRVKKIWRWFFSKKCKIIKPSGTVSMISNQSQGIEPVLKTHYDRYEITDKQIVVPEGELSKEDEEKLHKMLDMMVMDMFGNVHLNTNLIVHGDVIFDDPKSRV